MPINSRIRDNSVFGATSDNPLAIGATSFNSLGLANLSAVSSKHAIVTLDPLRQYGDPEIAVVTAHTSSATIASITRGAYGTTARAHPQNTLWVHAPINQDFISIVTSGTRPADPYEGQFIFETDTNKLYGYGGVDWAPRDAGGQIGYAQVIANQAGITTEVDLTGLTIAVTVGTGRRIKITGYAEYNSNAAATIITRIYEGATMLNIFQAYQATAGNGCSNNAVAILSPNAGSHTYKLTGQVSGGTGSLLAGATFPSFILVEDIGAA